MSLKDHMQLPLVITLNTDHMVNLAIFRGPLVFLLVDIIIDQLEYMTRDLHLIQVSMTIMDTIIIHPIALMIVCTINSSVTTIKVRNLNQIQHLCHILIMTHLVRYQI